MFEPIEGSEINSLARVFQRYTFHEAMTVEEAREIVIEMNNYINNDLTAFPYVETKPKKYGEEQPIDGLVVPGGDWGIAFYGTYSQHPKEPKHGAMIAIDNELWIVTEKEKIRDTSMVDFATVNLTLKKIM